MTDDLKRRRPTAPPPYPMLIAMKRWADEGLYEIVERELDRLPSDDVLVLLRLFDHMLVVDRIFQHHLLGTPHGYSAARSDPLPAFPFLRQGAREVGAWYADYVGGRPDACLEEALDFRFTSGKSARMRRSEMILHVCLHGSYHRGAIGLLLQKNGVVPDRDGLTDFLDLA